ncbi:hypothetical protein NPIL_428411 [Nephila pilipes]|uniref:Uncharacterized protein n=1 Tax=Nephila pilipes TaxID=299642 RepID=A0A8X6UTL6_NEPPI|nr:hypothetical protein NPIL_428411 [Nephila pilipes]
MMFCFKPELEKVLTRKLINVSLLAVVMYTTKGLSKIDQLSVIFRYILITEYDDVPKEIRICEFFSGFTSVADYAALELNTDIFDSVEKEGIDLSKCREQDHHRASAMSGAFGGLQALINE